MQIELVTIPVAVGGSEVAATDAGIEADVGVALVGELFSVAIMASKVWIPQNINLFQGR